MWDPRNYRDSDFGLLAADTFEPADAADWEDVDVTQPHIMTVLGPIDPGDLGICLHHEHILCNPEAIARDEVDFRLDRIDLAGEELDSYFSVGGRAMVDVSTPDYGRDLKGLQTIAQRVPINIIAVAGRHQHVHASHMSNAVDQASLEAEIRSDLARPFRPGVIMFGTSVDEITPVEEAAARAAARVAVDSGHPVSTHTGLGTMAHEQLDLVESEGLDPKRVIVGHLDRRLDWAYLLSLARRGAWLSFDRIGDARTNPDSARAKMLLDLAEAGYGGQLLVSQGLTRTSELVAFGGSPGWIHLLERFTLDLMEAGAEAAFVRQLLVDNPSRALSIQPR